MTLIAGALLHNLGLNELRLSMCRLIDQCLGPLAYPLRINTSLNGLWLVSNQFTDTELAVLGQSQEEQRTTDSAIVVPAEGD